MTTFVGTQTNFIDAIKALVELEYDAKEAYEEAISHLKNDEYKRKLIDFKQDHERHIRELAAALSRHGEDVPQGPDAKKWLTKGKVFLANVVGDKAILFAMKSNEIDTNTAYETIKAREDKWDDIAEIIDNNLLDEKRHKQWLDETVDISTLVS
jgi:rubrerythrin